LVNINPNDGNIAKEFLKWSKAGGKVLNGLTNRRIAESALYFTK
jgi:lysozyme